jgi:hypothetical protein
MCGEIIDEIRSGILNAAFRSARNGDLSGSWDIGRIGQLLSNLVGNAAQHGRVQLRRPKARRTGGRAEHHHGTMASKDGCEQPLSRASTPSCRLRFADLDDTMPESPSVAGGIDRHRRKNRAFRAPGWPGPRDMLQVGRRVRIAGHCELFPKSGSLPIAFRVEFIDAH